MRPGRFAERNHLPGTRCTDGVCSIIRQHGGYPQTAQPTENGAWVASGIPGAVSQRDEAG